MKTTNEIRASSNSIRYWSEEDIPSYRLLLKGKGALSNTEILCSLIGSGSGKHNAYTIAAELMKRYGSIQAIAKASYHDLLKTPGIGHTTASRIIPALEIGRRRQLEGDKEQQQIRSSQDACAILAPHLRDIEQEKFYVLYCNRSNRVVEYRELFSGGVAGTVADGKMIFKHAVEILASSIIVAHNHPSGNLKPSQADIDLTKNLKEAGKMLEINLLDHLIITDDCYYSFTDEGLI